MKKMILLSAALLLFTANAYAADDTGVFEIEDVTVNGSAWEWDLTDPNAVIDINVGETYSVDMSVSYNVSLLAPFQSTYSDSISAEIKLPNLAGFGPVVWTASQATPDGLLEHDVFGTNQVDFAVWNLSGDLLVENSPLLDYNPRWAGLYLSTGEGISGLVDVDYRLANINNPVPEPSTMLLFGAGLLGLVGYTRKKKKA